MPSNVAVSNQELVEVNNSLYGSTRMELVTPLVTQFAGNEKNYSTGGLQNQVMKSIAYDLVQRAEKAGTISALAELVNSASTEIAQGNVAPVSFEYVRRALIIEITYSSLDQVSKTQPRARMLAELMKQYDYSSYMGFFSNYGIEKNPKRVDIASSAISDLASALSALKSAVTPLKTLGWNKNKNNLLTIAYTEDIGEKLATVGAGRTMSDLDVLMGEYEGANFIEIPEYLKNSKPRFEVGLRPLITHHHSSLPSLYNDYTAPNGMSTVDMFSFETSTIELEETGAIQRKLVSIA